MIDKKDKTPLEIARSEVLEECGYDVPLHNFKHVLTFLSGVGVNGENMHLYFAQVTDDMRVSDGGGLEIEGEMIDVVEMSIQDAEAYLSRKEVKSPLFTIYGLSWFLSMIKTGTWQTSLTSSVMCATLAVVLAFGLSN